MKSYKREMEALEKKKDLLITHAEDMALLFAYQCKTLEQSIEKTLQKHRNKMAEKESSVSGFITK